MCNECINNEVLNNNEKEINEYINVQTGEVLDLSRVEQLKDNAMLKVKPEMWEVWNFEKNGELGLDVWKMTKGSRVKAWWYCDKCDDNYPQSILSKNNNKKCSICNGRYITSKNSLASLNPSLAKQWHPTKNGELTPNDVTCGNGKKAWWLGECGHEWDAVIVSRVNGCGCPYCTGQKVLVGFNDICRWFIFYYFSTTTTFPI